MGPRPPRRGRRRGAEPVFGTIASRFNDDGVTALFHRLKAELEAKGMVATEGVLPPVAGRTLDPDIAARPRRSGTATWPRSPRPSPATTRATDRLVAEARRSEQMAAVVAAAERRGVDAGDLRRTGRRALERGA